MSRDLLKGMSAPKLRALAQEAKQLADDLEKSQPTVALALANGIKNTGYDTVANGYVRRYEGVCEIVMSDGKRWKAVGHVPQGTAAVITRDGWVEFIPLD